VQGDFGNDLSGVSVRSQVFSALWPSLELAALAAIFSLPIAIVLSVAVVSQRHRGTAEAMNSVSLVGAIIPPFWLGLLLILVFAVWLRWLPASGYASLAENPADNLRTIAMPATVLTVGLVAVYYRFLQQGLREALDSSYVKTARAKGLSERRIIYRHVVPNAVLPTLTIVGVQIGALIGGVVIVERVFNWPGIGSLLIHAANQGSYNTVTLIVLVIAVIYVVTSLLIDLAYGIIDPRTRRA
jgi:peptide/nickel transport system permease protein